jgi:demethylmenaquinone methyltransferase/2-methoxy-6-polyprenyl-1,4-benzoquinol methylase
MPMLAEMKRVIRPGGTLAILAWSSERLLPGFPLLEATLQSTAAGMAPFSAGQDPSTHLFRSLGLLRKVGLTNVRAATAVGTAHAPLDDPIRKGLETLFDMRWKGVSDELREKDRTEFARLCRTESPECVLHLPDYYALFTYSIFFGTVA